MNNKTIYFTVLAFALLASIIFGVFMTLSISQSADSTIPNINAYSADKVKYFDLISWLFIACLAVFLFFTFTQKRNFGKSLKPTSQAYKCASILGGIISSSVVIFSVIIEIVSSPYIVGAIENSASDGFYRFVKYTAFGKSFNFSYICFVLLFALSAFYFLRSAFKQEKPNNKLATLSLFPVLTLAIKLVFDFLMQNTNGFGKLYNYHLLSLGFLLLFFLNESRFYMRKSAPALYVFFGLATSVATSIYSIPVLILCLSNVAVFSAFNLFYAIIDIALVVYVYTRLLNLSIKIPRHIREGCVVEATETNTDI